ncbi:MAG: helix-turn-helix transcriptional regulator [Tannerella sp.]|jgi:DNA-binding Xre family transcriptional regulator|nr:helix-turn-helix transcriptional regulator [Tannerella sp.]
MGISYRPLFVLLAQKGLKKTDLYKLADLTPNTVARFAKGEPVSLEIIERLCKALECTPNDIFEITE